ncbi:glycosyltransferase family 2 protein [Entomomonas asaccharolytica]|uniref:Glycosyltransferase family 2 protein n=1 Tax=Entomomonas asaccharolytica TaxID=2785331 RepID=A0A974ND17_9GAMM|nr:glycosyltransferase family 2 protein [Entomomonas asaccharolytica]QQP84403.1 glycosyltransferase family 2 protein [Entomomonas asaccharolytica]
MLTNDTPRIAVVIPLYNKEFSVARAVSSVLNQTKDFQQLIIVDDGSTDNSLSVVKQFIDPRIIVITQTNQGVSAARNNGVKNASAEYICFLDADDEWHPCFLEEISKLIKLNKQAAIFCARYEEVTENGKRFVGNLVNIDDNFYGQLADFFSAYQGNRSLICSSNSCLNRRYFQQMGSFPVGAKLGEDIYLWLSVALLAPVMFTTKISAKVYRNAENRSHTLVKLVVPYHISYFLNPVQKSLLIKNPTLKSFLIYNTVIFCLYAAQTGNRKVAFSAAKLLIKHDFLYGLTSFIGICLPKWCINLLKKLRNKKTLSYEN